MSITVNFAYATTVTESSPWVYPFSESDPTSTDYYKVPLTGGYNEITLILWNHHNRHYFYDGKFVIALKAQTDNLEIQSVKIGPTTFFAPEKTNSGDKNPGADEGIRDGRGLPDGDIFPCPWIQYDITGAIGRNYLSPWENPSGWDKDHPDDDKSGVKIVIILNIPYPESSEDNCLCFLAFGWKDPEYENIIRWTYTPYSHITETVPVEPFVIPEFVYGTIMSVIAPILAIGVLKYRKKH